MAQVTVPHAQNRHVISTLKFEEQNNTSRIGGEFHSPCQALSTARQNAPV